jgi:hypothetical protein
MSGSNNLSFSQCNFIDFLSSPAGIAHVQNVNSYHSRLRNWLSIFHGVASR